MTHDVTVSVLSALCGRKATQELQHLRAQELCKNRGGRPGLPVPNSPYGHRGRKATLTLNRHKLIGPQ